MTICTAFYVIWTPNISQPVHTVQGRGAILQISAIREIHSSALRRFLTTQGHPLPTAKRYWVCFPPAPSSLHSSLIPASWTTLGWYKGPVSRAIGKTNKHKLQEVKKKWIYSKQHSHHTGTTVLFMRACNSPDCSYVGMELKFCSLME